MIPGNSRLLIVDALIEPCEVLDPNLSLSSLAGKAKDGSGKDMEDRAPYPLSQSFGLGNEFNMVSDTRALESERAHLDSIFSFTIPRFWI